MEQCYVMGVYPDYWKILPPEREETWARMEELIMRHDPYCRGILILGNDASEQELRQAFAHIPHDERVLGFAIGRSIFRAPAQRWFADEIGDDEAVQAMKEAFSRLIESWNHR